MSGTDLKVEKELYLDVNYDFKVDANIDLDKNVNIDFDVDAKTDVDGNSANAIIDVEALGKDTFTELDLVILTVEDELSSISAVATSAVG